MTEPGINWWIGGYVYRVKRDFMYAPNKDKIQKSMIEGFFRWAANQRLKYEEDIIDEIDSFCKNVYAKNLSWLNNKHKYKFLIKVIERDGGYCKHCNITKTLSLDHIIPRSKGGLDEINNLQILCRSCNSSKGNKYNG